MQKLRIALDWTPNTNHTGFFVALEKGFYKDHDIELEIISPLTDNYAITPAKRLENGEVDFAIVPSESVLSLYTKDQPVHIRAIAALLQEDTSAIVTLKSSGIDRPSQLDGKTYASYKARYEDKIVEQMIRNDGGTGSIDVAYPAKLGIWNTLLSGEFSATWIFTNWEGVEAKNSNVELTYFHLEDYGIPYGYSPVLVAKDVDITANTALYTKFLSSTRNGFLFATTNVEESAGILKKYVTPHDAETIDLVQSQRETNTVYGDQESWGKMTTERWRAFIDWLYENKLINETIDVSLLFTNSLITSA
jgi:ABC-type nitrate/sulfonate/bicarbonate transport system substrate-binding protein